jgi:endonuclease/exonuclease/phosphatase family metal-dependent hydrolase
MRVLTWNIHNWQTAEGAPNLAGVIETLAASGADVIGLNEVSYPLAAPGDSRPALEVLAAALGMHFVFGPCVRWPAHNDIPATGYGNALLARWPIAASAAHHLTPVPGYGDRGLLEARIVQPNGDTFTVYVTHLDHTSEDARSRQFRAARQWLIRDRSRPHILMGDMNAVSPWDFAQRPDDLAALAQHPRGSNLVGGPGGDATGMKVIPQIEKAGYVDLHRQVGNPPGERSYVRAALDLRIDFIFASQPLAPQATACATITRADVVSDHRPVWAEFALN